MFFLFWGSRGIFAYYGDQFVGCSHRLCALQPMAGTGARHALVWLRGSGWMMFQMSQMYFFGYLHTFGRGCPPQYQASQSIKATQLVAVASTKPCWLSVRSRGGGGTSGCCGGFLWFQLLMILVASRVCNFRTLQVSMDIRLKLSCRSYVTIL